MITVNKKPIVRDAEQIRTYMKRLKVEKVIHQGVTYRLVPGVTPNVLCKDCIRLNRLDCKKLRDVKNYEVAECDNRLRR